MMSQKCLWEPPGAAGRARTWRFSSPLAPAERWAVLGWWVGREGGPGQPPRPTASLPRSLAFWKRNILLITTAPF